MTCLAAKSDHDIVCAVKTAVNMDESSLQCLRSNVIEYYESYVKPEAYLGALMSGAYASVEMIAEWHSVSLYERSFRGNVSPMTES